MSVNLDTDHARTARSRIRALVRLVALVTLMTLAQGCAPAEQTNTSSSQERLAVGGSHACAVDANGELYCWGLGSSGQLGTGDESTHTVATKVPLPGEVRDIALGASTTCAVLADNTVWCWGDGTHGEVGIGVGNSSSVPVQVPEIDDAVRIATGIGMSCAVLETGQVDCWGSDVESYFGLAADRGGPARVPGLEDIVDIEGTKGTWCAMKRTGEVWCWGEAFTQVDGDAAANPSQGLTQINGIEGVVDIAVSNSTMCAVEASGTLKCWGLAVPEHDNLVYTMDPVTMPVGPVRSVATGLFNGICAVTVDAEAVCWDDPSGGHVEGTPVTFGAPETVRLTGEIADLAVGQVPKCAQMRDGAVWCWGSNGGGTLGAGDDVAESHTPWRIVGLGDEPSDGDA